MRRTIAALAVVACTGCGANPVAPTPEVVEVKATKLSGYTCYTQPREYIWPDGSHVWEIDFYRSDEPCPEVPIP